jgi:GNAT superfamily N-acetyltransferase
MAGSDQLEIVDLRRGDVEAGLALSGEAGWNQTGEDWRHFIENGRTIGVCNGSGTLIASAAALPYEGPFGFIGMVLVTKDSRRQGIATRLVDRCIGELRGRGLTPVLDATAAGAEVYKRQGFLPQFGFDRWEGTVQGSPQGQRAESPQQLDRLAARDSEAFGASRAGLLGDFLSRSSTHAEVSGAGDGFAMIRRGRRALQAGPVVASSEVAALDLLERIFARVSGLVFVDVPSVWRGIAAWLAARGFFIQRSFTRMALHRAEPFGSPEKLFAVAGPEFG